MLIFGKRGTEGQPVIVYLAIGILFAGLVVLGVVNKSLEDIKGETLEKNYIARDIALVLDSVYAVPCDLKYAYSEQDYHYAVEFKDRRVYVGKACNDKNAGVYAFFDGGLEDSDKLTKCLVPNKNSLKPMLIIFEKKDSVVSVRVGNNFPESEGFGGGGSGGGGASRNVN